MSVVKKQKGEKAIERLELIDVNREMKKGQR